MNSKFKKSISIGMAMLLSCSTFVAVGCGGNEGPSSDSEIKPTSNNTFYTISPGKRGFISTLSAINPKRRMPTLKAALRMWIYI